MVRFGHYSLLTRDGHSVACETLWLSTSRDWIFAAQWQDVFRKTHSQSIRDSIEYAQIGKKRWQWLARRGEAAAPLEAAQERLTNNPESEFGFALAVRLITTGRSGVCGFCYARRLWTGTLCLEFLSPRLRLRTGSLLAPWKLPRCGTPCAN